MNANSTPETDALADARIGMWQHNLPADFARQLERERDEARVRADSKHDCWMSELRRTTELEKQVEAMREAIREAHTQIRYAYASFAGMALRLHPADPDNDAVLARTGNALAKLKPFTTGTP
jgi:hypothetical protein